MHITLKTDAGKEITMIAPGADTRQKFSELYGDPFQMDRNNQFSKKYSTKEVIAKPSPDTSIAWIIIVFLVSLFFFKKEDHCLYIALVIAFIVYIWRLAIVSFDKKAVEKFNNS